MENIKDCKILIIDDELFFLEMVKNIMVKEEFYEVFIVCNCYMVIDKFREIKFYVVILDVMLFDGDGFFFM